MSLRTWFVVIATILGVLQVVPYIRSVLKGQTKPSRVAYLIWFFTDCVTFAGLVAVGFSGAAWLTLSFIFTQLFVIALLPKYGVGGKSKFDIACFVFGLLAIVGWIVIQTVFHSLENGAIFAVVMTTSAVLVANINMIRKLLAHPLSEDVTAWGITLTAGLFTFGSLILGGSLWIDFAPTSLTLITSVSVILIQVFQKRKFSHQQEFSPELTDDCLDLVCS